MPVEVDREVEEVGHEGNGRAVPGQAGGLQDIQPFDDEDVRAFDHPLLPRDPIVDEVRVERRRHPLLAGLHLVEKAQQRGGVVALGKTLALHEAVGGEFGVRQQEPIGGDEIDLGRVRPAGEEGGEDARGGGFAHRHRSGQPDDVGELRLALGDEEALGRLEQTLRRCNVEGEQPGQGKVDLHDLFDGDRVVQGFQPFEIVGVEGEGSVGAQMRPLLSAEVTVGREADLAVRNRGRRVHAWRLDAFSARPLWAVRRSNSSITASSSTLPALSSTIR